MKHLFFISLVVLSFALLFLSIGIGTAAVQDVLRLDEDKSYVLNLETGSKLSYTDFLRPENSKQFEGDRLEFNIYVSKTGNPILDDYVLELRTNMDDPEWKFGDYISHKASDIVWKGKEEHELMVPKVILSGEVPKPIKKVKEPGFEAYDIYGIGEGEVYVELTVGTTRDGATLETIIQPLEPTIKFFSTNKEIQDAEDKIDKNLEEAKGKIGPTGLEEEIRKLYEEGHPGWASKLSEHYKELSVAAEPPPLTLYVILSVMLGLMLGSVFVYVYASRGGGKGVDVSQISAELDDTSGKIDEKSSSINAISTKFARSEDDEKRSVARELIKIRASLNELSSEIRTIADRIRGFR
ncbi:MAG: hypothetical protein H8D26_03065 [Methanomicrobia archaeon]|nr:hypothetical protein [Methanomicrobia archaeon]